MRIYTKNGDKGMTRLIGGASVAKDSDRVESYGTVDELNSWLGYSASCFSDSLREQIAELHTIQHFLFDVGTDLATPSQENRPSSLPDYAVDWLERRIDWYTEETPDLTCFILPGGSKEAGMMHMARTIARRAERRIIRLNTLSEVNPEIIKFINRLSDYFFALARYANHVLHVEDVKYERGQVVFHK